MDKYNMACKCVIVPTTHAQDDEINRLEEVGADPTFFIRSIYNASDELIADVDCQICGGSGVSKSIGEGG